MAIINIEKILISGALSFGSSTIDTDPSDSPLSGFSKLISQNRERFFPNGDITFILFKRAPRFLEVGTVWGKLTLTGEASFVNVKVIPTSSYSKFGIPNFLTDQITFIADERIILSSKSQVLSVEI